MRGQGAKKIFLPGGGGAGGIIRGWGLRGQGAKKKKIKLYNRNMYFKFLFL